MREDLRGERDSCIEKPALHRESCCRAECKATTCTQTRGVEVTILWPALSFALVGSAIHTVYFVPCLSLVGHPIGLYYLLGKAPFTLTLISPFLFYLLIAIDLLEVLFHVVTGYIGQ